MYIRVRSTAQIELSRVWSGLAFDREPGRLALLYGPNYTSLPLRWERINDAHRPSGQSDTAHCQTRESLLRSSPISCPLFVNPVQTISSHPSHQTLQSSFPASYPGAPTASARPLPSPLCVDALPGPAPAAAASREDPRARRRRRPRRGRTHRSRAVCAEKRYTRKSHRVRPPHARLPWPAAINHAIYQS